MTDPIARLLYEGALAVQQGRSAEGRDKLMQVVEQDENIEMAWLWLSGAVTDPADQQVALENVLLINPDNPHAKRGLDWLKRHNGTIKPGTGQLKPATGPLRQPATGPWQPPPPWDENEVVEIRCWQCSATLYSVAPFCWSCHAAVRCCNNCVFRHEHRCKELQGLMSPITQQARNDCPWWRPKPA